MGRYYFAFEHYLGTSHCGDVTIDVDGDVELSDEQVDVLVNLIREKQTTDVNELGLESLYPEIYQKLKDEYRSAAYCAEELHWLWEIYEDHNYDCDMEELMEYCEKECGFIYEPTSSNDEDDDEDDEDYDEEKEEAFLKWLDNYLRSLCDDDAASFFVERMEIDLDISYQFDFDYVGIPDEIIEIAQN